jgi:hypothetical protein
VHPFRGLPMKPQSARNNTMPTSRLYVASFGGAVVLFSLCHGMVCESADAWQPLLALAPLLIVVTWWMVDRAALERHIRRLEARSAIAAGRRVTARTDISEAEHRLKTRQGTMSSRNSRAAPRVKMNWTCSGPPLNSGHPSDH